MGIDWTRLREQQVDDQVSAWSSSVNWELVPERMRGGLQRYVERGKLPGHFLCALLENDLAETVGRADHENIKIIPDYVKWLYNEAPSECWGSPEKVKAWSAKGGLRGGK